MFYKIKLLPLKWAFLFIASSLILTGCGDTGSSATSTPPPATPSPTTVSITGVVVDGYLDGAIVFLDLNGNGILDTGEPSAISDANGNYSLSVSPTQAAAGASIVVDVPATAIDKDTGLPVGTAFVMSAPADSYAVISPMSTLIKKQMDKNAGLTIADAQEKVKFKIGLSGSTVDLLADYVAASQNLASPNAAEYARVHKIARVSAEAVKSNLADVQAAAASSGASLEDIIGVIVDKILAELGNIALQVDLVPTSNFDPYTALGNTAVSTISTTIINADIAAVQAAAQTPVITLNGPNQLTVVQGSTFIDAGATANSNIDGDISASIVMSGAVNTSTVGTYTLTYDVHDAAGNAAAQVLRIISVAAAPDTTAPVLTLVGNANVNWNTGTLYTAPNPGATSDDPYATVTVTGYVNSAVSGVYTLTYNAVDGAGNQAAPVTRIINMSDTTPPAVFVLNGAANVSILKGAAYVEQGVFAWDAVDKDISANVVITGGPVNVNLVGAYVLTYNISDAAGNAAPTLTRTVNVTLDTVPPVVAAPPALTVEATAALMAPNLGMATATDNVDGTLSPLATPTAPYTVGVHTITWTATDAAGNVGTATQTLTILDTTAPMITAPVNKTVEATGSLTAVTVGAPTGVSDLTSTPTVTNNVPVAGFPVGMTLVNWTASDGFGNSTTVTQTITITDSTPPTITLQGASPISVTQGATYTDVGATATDLVDGIVTVSSSSTVNTATVGNYTVTYNAIDAVGNAATAVIRSVNVVAGITADPLLSLVSNGNSLHYLDAADTPFTPIARNYAYGTLSLDAATGKMLDILSLADPSTGSFVVDPYGRNTMEITSNGVSNWQLIDRANDTFIDNAFGSVTIAHPDGITDTLTSVESTVAGQTIVSTLATQYPSVATWGDAVNPVSAFSTGASVVTISNVSNNDRYQIEYYNDAFCTPYGPAGNCKVTDFWDHNVGCIPGVQPSPPTILSNILTLTGSQLPCAVAGTTNNKDVFILGGTDGYIGVVLLAASINSTSGTVNFYDSRLTGIGGGSVDFTNGGVGVAVPPTATGTWNQVTLAGGAAYMFNIPASIARAPWDQGVTQGFFTVQDGFVRRGLLYPQGSVKTDVVLNQVAINDMLANFDSQKVTGSPYYYMEVVIDPYEAPIIGLTTGGQVSHTGLELGILTPNIASSTMGVDAFAANGDGIPDPATALLVGGSVNVVASAPNQLRLTTASGSLWNYEFSQDGQFGMGDFIHDGGFNLVRLHVLVKKPKVAPTLASMAGVYHLALLAQDNSLAPTAINGYTESGLLTLDGFGGFTYTATNTSLDQFGNPVFAPVNGTNSYSVDSYGAVLNTGGNGRLVVSDNGQYALYELHAPGGTQEWGIAIKDHTTTIPFSAMVNGIAYDVHNQGSSALKGLDVRQLAPAAAPDTATWASLRAFKPLQLTPPAMMCGTPLTAACTQVIPLTYFPVAPNTAQSAVNGDFTVMDSGFVGQIPNFTSYISQDGGVFWTDDGEAGSIVIGITR